MTIRALLLGAAFASAPWTVQAFTLDARVTGQDGGPLQDVIVYAIPSQPSTVAPVPAIIEQKGKAFLPLVTAVQTGASINFPNNDTVRHHIYSFSPVRSFEVKLYSGVPTTPIVFDKPGIVTLGCNIHDRMIAFVYVVDTPHFAKTGADGKALIDGLPSGNYKVGVWYYGAVDSVPERSLMIKQREAIEFKVSVKPFRPTR